MLVAVPVAVAVVVLVAVLAEAGVGVLGTCGRCWLQVWVASAPRRQSSSLWHSTYSSELLSLGVV